MQSEVRLEKTGLHPRYNAIFQICSTICVILTKWLAFRSCAPPFFLSYASPLSAQWIRRSGLRSLHLRMIFLVVLRVVLWNCIAPSSTCQFLPRGWHFAIPSISPPISWGYQNLNRQKQYYTFCRLNSAKWPVATLAIVTSRHIELLFAKLFKQHSLHHRYFCQACRYWFASRSNSFSK